jgi:hypothetical protein
MREQHSSPLGRIKAAVFDELPRASRFGGGITLRGIPERTGLAERQVRDALARLNRHGLAFCFDKDERNAGLWERTRSDP